MYEKIPQELLLNYLSFLLSLLLNNKRCYLSAGYDLIANITQIDWSVVKSILGDINFGYQGNVSMIPVRHKFPYNEEILNLGDNLILYYMPALFLKINKKLIWTLDQEL